MPVPILNSVPSILMRLRRFFARNHCRAFTLTEVLAAVAITAILIGLLLPVAGLVCSQARSAQCASNMRQIAASLIAYAYDNNGRTVCAHYLAEDDNWAQKVTVWDGSSKFLSEGKSFGIWRCPENRDQTKVPMANGEGVRNTSYMINGYKNNTETPDFRYGNTPTAMIQKPSRLYMVLEGRYFRCTVSGQSGNKTIPENIYPGSGSLDLARYPHSGKMNVAFADGHVEIRKGPIEDRGNSGGTQMRGFTNGDAWYAY